MKEREYIISIDQSTQGTKALLFDRRGRLVLRTDLPHRQIINNQGWVSHDLKEIYHNTMKVVAKLVEKSGIHSAQIAGIGISNQRETTAIWDRNTGAPLEDAIVWQCGRAGGIARELENQGYGDMVKEITGIPLSPYFPAAKMAWLLRNGIGGSGSEDRMKMAEDGKLCLGTIDSWLLFKLTEEHLFRTDYSNASRTQLLNLQTLQWDDKLCRIFRIPKVCLAEIYDSDALFGHTKMGGLFEEPVPICGVVGDSHGALFGQGCLEPGMIKATYGTGSSLMMNVGKKPVISSHGVVTSLAWGRKGEVTYVLEGNLNYTGAVITWLKDNLKLITSAKETEQLALTANPGDKTYLVPAFTGLGAPYWDDEATAEISGITRITGKAELVKAALECIAYQITDLVLAMEQDTGIAIEELRVDGGPTRNKYLMQFQSDIMGKMVNMPDTEELSGIGAAYMAGLSSGLYCLEMLSNNMQREIYRPQMDKEIRREKYQGWKHAVAGVLNKKK